MCKFLNNKYVENYKESNESDIYIYVITEYIKYLEDDFVEIMNKYAKDFNWGNKIKTRSDNDSNSESESEEEIKPKNKITTKKESEFESEEEKPLHENLQNKVDIYKKYKIINPDYNIKKIPLSGRSISHIIDNDKEYKYCSTCKNWKLVEEYFISSKNWDLLDRRCKICKKKSTYEANINWKQNNKNKISDYNKKYREENIETIKHKCNLTKENKEENKLERRKKYFEKTLEVIKQNDGECLSTIDDYENAHSKLKIKCSVGHIFKKSSNGISRSWCPSCNIFYGEAYSRYILEQFFDCEFNKIRPEWLLNKEGNKLELDGYNEEYKIAFEY